VHRRLADILRLVTRPRLITVENVVIRVIPEDLLRALRAPEEDGGVPLLVFRLHANGRMLLLLGGGIRRLDADEECLGVKTRSDLLKNPLGLGLHEDAEIFLVAPHEQLEYLTHTCLAMATVADDRPALRTPSASSCGAERAVRRDQLTLFHGCDEPVDPSVAVAACGSGWASR
jgi:hypothetical protein